MFLLPNACFTPFIHRNIGLPLGLLIHLRLHHQSLIIHLHHVTEPSQNTLIYSVLQLPHHPRSNSHNVIIDPISQGYSSHAPWTFHLENIQPSSLFCSHPSSLGSVEHSWGNYPLIQSYFCFHHQRPSVHHTLKSSPLGCPVS